MSGLINDLMNKFQSNDMRWIYILLIYEDSQEYK